MMMELLLAHRKAIVGAILTILVGALRVYWPDIASTEMQEALRVLLEAILVGSGIWYTSNHQKSVSNVKE